MSNKIKTLKTKWIEPAIHILFWISTGWIITTGLSVQSHEIEIINDTETIHIIRNSALIYQLLICIFFSLIVFYYNTCISFALSRIKTIKHRIRHSLLPLSVALLLVYGAIHLNYFHGSAPVPKALAFGIVIFYYALSVAYGLTRLLLHKTQREQQLMLDKRQAELSLLRNQLQPHFLFNAINNLLSMVDPEKDPSLIKSFQQLSLLLRYVIEETRAGKVSIEKEMAFLKNYIDLQLLRFNQDEINFHFLEKGQFNKQQIEPGLFIAFVENAFKYGTEPERKATIHIEFDVSEPDSLSFKIRNKVLIRNVGRRGTGIETTQKRLDLIYPNSYKLSISKNEYFVVELNIKTT